MITRLGLLTLILLSLCSFGLNSSWAQQDEWQDLFDGSSLDGWVQRGGKAKYEVVDGVIVGTTVPNTPNSFLCTEKQFTDFELELEFKVHPELNSGIQIRSNSLEDYKNGRVHGYQVEIDPSDRAWSAGIYDEGRRGWLDDLKDNDAARHAFKQDDWNHYRIRAVGDRIQTWINGVPAADLQDDMTDRGFIALQVHGVGGREDPISVQWRNIRILENPQDDYTEETLVDLIPSSTAMTLVDLNRLAKPGELAKLEMFDNQSLTLAILLDNVFEDSSKQRDQEFQFTHTHPDPTKIVEEVQRDGTGSLFQADRITKIRYEQTSDHQFDGEFWLEVPDMLKARVKFVAEQLDGKWTMVEFRMPARGFRVRPDEKGIWKKQELDPVFDEDVEIKKLADGFKFTEGPAAGPDGRIYFNDIPNSTTHVFDPASGETTVFRENTGRANGLAWTANDALLSCEGGNRRVSWMLGERRRILADKFEEKQLNSPNDLTLDTKGGFYFSDPRYGEKDNLELDVEGVYYVSRDRKIQCVAKDLKRPNGLVLSPDGSILYVADHGAGKTWAYDVKPNGSLGNKQIFAQIGSDGMTTDADGNVYFTWDGAIIVYSGGGNEIARLEMPEKPANCVLVGDTLYVTARTGFYAVTTNRRSPLN